MCSFYISVHFLFVLVLFVCFPVCVNLNEMKYFLFRVSVTFPLKLLVSAQRVNKEKNGIMADIKCQVCVKILISVNAEDKLVKTS